MVSTPCNSYLDVLQWFFKFRVKKLRHHKYFIFTDETKNEDKQVESGDGNESSRGNPDYFRNVLLENYALFVYNVHLLVEV